MLHTWQWCKSQSRTQGVTHWVWDDESKLVTGYSTTGRVSHPSYRCRGAREWFARHTDSWAYVMDPDLEMDTGL